MIKTIKLGKETELALSNNLAWAMIYKDQFGHDIVPDIMPVLSAVMKLLGEMQGKEDLAGLLKNSDVVDEALIELCSVQFVDFLHLIWAMAKANDDNIETPEKWVRQFDEFPLDIVAPAVLDLLTKGLVSSKNLKSLRNIPKATSPLK